MKKIGMPDYDDLVKTAEEAVAGVKDPELKRAAFEKVLDDLLGRGSETSVAPRKVRAAKSPARKSSQGGPKTYISELAEEGFFKKPKTIAEVRAELGNRGHHIPLTSLSGPLQSLCKGRTLRRHRAKTSGKKQTYIYSNW